MDMQSAISTAARKTKRQQERDDRLMRCFEILKRAAENGETCPTNADLADMLGYSAPNKASDVVSLLEVMGLIRVARGRKNRVVTICKTGQKTAGVVLKRSSTSFTEDDDAILMDGIAEGLSFPQVGLILKRTTHACSSRFYRIAAQMGDQAQ